MLNKSRIHVPRSTHPDADNFSLLSHTKPRVGAGVRVPHSSSASSSSFNVFKSSTMRNKARLHLALYALPKYPDTYHYALLVRPKDIAATSALSGVLTATKYHVKSTIRTNADGVVSHPCIYETYHIHDLADEPLILASIVIGKVSVSHDRIGEIMRSAPIYQDDDSSGQGAKFNDVEWVRLAIEELRQTGAVSDDGLPWETVFERSMNYMRRKQADGRWEAGWKGGDPKAVATFDLMTGKDVLF